MPGILWYYINWCGQIISGLILLKLHVPSAEVHVGSAVHAEEVRDHGPGECGSRWAGHASEIIWHNCLHQLPGRDPGGCQERGREDLFGAEPEIIFVGSAQEGEGHL